MKNIFKKDNIRNKQLVASLFVIGLILLVVGISYAMYTFTGTGTKENVITTGQITVEFAEQNNILIQNRYPETDAVGLASTDPNSQMTFTVSSNIAGTATVNYAVGLTEIEEGATLTEDYIKINLTKNGSAATGFTSDAGKIIKSFKNETFSDLLTSHVIARGTVSGTQTDTYTLKAWIHEDYNLPTTDTSSGKVHSSTTTSEEFSFKIKVAGTDATQNEEEDANIPNAPELATNMIPVTYDGENWIKADSTNSNNSWYNYDNKVWANAVTVTSTNRDTYLDATPGTPISMDDINTMWVWIPRFSATTNTLDCSTLVNSTAEKYPQCYQNISDAVKQKAIAAIQQFGLSDPEGVLERSLNGELVEFGGMVGDLSQTVAYYNTNAAPDSISIDYSTFFPDRVVTGANGGTQSNPGAFNIDFVTTNETAHEAFTLGNDEYAGIWVGKFETSHSSLEPTVNTQDNLACINDSCENAKGLRILPNVKPLTDQNVSNFFYAGRSMEQVGNNYGLLSNEIDTHMIKNPEWGAVAYLSQSIYGRCTSQIDCKEIGVSNYFMTGHGAPAGSSGFSESSNYVASQPYNTEQGMDASTTGNIYGIYDMSGGAGEFVMGVYTDGSKLWSGDEYGNSGFNGCLGVDCASEKLDGLAFPETKYYNTYTTETDYLNNGLQHALTETYYWYGDYMVFVSSESPWFGRGGGAIAAEVSGIFSYHAAPGTAASVSLRAVLVK